MHQLLTPLLVAVPASLVLVYAILAYVNHRGLTLLARGVESVRFPVLRELLDEEVRRVRREALLHPLRTASRISDWHRLGVEFYFESLANRGGLEFEDPINGTSRDIWLLDAIEAHNLQWIWPQHRPRITNAAPASPRGRTDRSRRAA